MPFKPKHFKPIQGDIAEPKDFDKTYDGYKELVNGGLDRENLPEEAFDKSQFNNYSFGRYYQTYCKLEEPYIITTMVSGLAPSDDFLKTPGTYYGNYAGGWIENGNDKMQLNFEAKEGMVLLEFNCWAYMGKLNGGGYYQSGPGDDYAWYQFQLVYNGTVVAETDRLFQNYNTIHLNAAVPTSAGPSEVKVRWRHNGRPNSEFFELSAPLLYWSGGNLFAFNRYR